METEKKFKRGDVREDGKVFWHYSHKGHMYPRWVTREKFNILQRRYREKNSAATSGKMPSKKLRVLSRGDVRDDGKIFWGYHPGATSGESWVSKEQFAKIKSRILGVKRGDNRPSPHLRVLKRGDTRPDGMVFASYMGTAVGGERWVTPDDLLKKALVDRIRCRLRAAVRGGKFSRVSADYASVPWLLWLAGKTGLDPKQGRRNHIDHLVPLSRVDLSSQEMQIWANSPYNVRWLPGPENVAKADRLPTEQELADHAALLSEYYASTDYLQSTRVA